MKETLDFNKLIKPNRHHLSVEKAEENCWKQRFPKSLSFFCASPHDFEDGGPGQVLFLQFIRFFAFVFFLCVLANIPLMYIMSSTLKQYKITDISSMIYFSQASVFDYSIIQFGTTDVTSQATYILVLTDVVVLLIVSGATQHWFNKSKEINDKFEDETHFPSDYTLEFDNVPINFTDEELRNFFEDMYGNTIAEINIANKSLRTMNKFDKQVAAAENLKDVRTSVWRKNNPEGDIGQEGEPRWLIERGFDPEVDKAWDALDKEMNNLNNNQDQLPTFEFQQENDFACITFKHEIHATKILKHQLKDTNNGKEKDHSNISHKFKWKDHQDNHHILKVRRIRAEPIGMIWENAVFEKKEIRKDIIKVYIIIILTVILCLILLYFVLQYQNELVRKPVSTIHPTLFEQQLPLIISIGIAVLQHVVKQVIVQLVPLLRPESDTVQAGIIIFFYSIASFLLFIAMPLVMSYTSSIGKKWYQSTGATIQYNMMMMMISSVAGIIYYPIGMKYFSQIQAKFTADTQYDLDIAFAGTPFLANLQIIYCSVFCFIMGVLFLSPSAPVLFIVGSIGMLVLQYVQKFMIVHFYKKDYVGPEINNMGDDLLPISIMLYCGWSIQTYANSDFLASKNIWYREIIFIVILLIVFSWQIQQLCCVNIEEEEADQEIIPDDDIEYNKENLKNGSIQGEIKSQDIQKNHTYSFRMNVIQSWQGKEF